jgi:cytochrome bd-type quinol oxidase subunit 1
VATVDATAALLAPVDAPIFTAATMGFDTASNLLATQAKAYLANPSAGVLAQIQTQIVTFQQQVNASLLQAAKIVDPASQKHALNAIQEVAMVVSAIFALVQSISSNAVVAQMAAHSTIKLAAIEPYLDHAQAARLVAAHYSEPLGLARIQVVQAEQSLALAGF